MLPSTSAPYDPAGCSNEVQMQHQYWQQAQSMQSMQTMQPVPHGQSQRYSGRVKSFSATNGYGFLTSPEVTAAFGQDIFVHQLEVDKITGVPKAPLPCGTNVSFTVVPNKRGQPQARDLQIQGAMGVDPSMMAGVPGSNASMAAIQSAMMAPQHAGFQDYNSASQSYDPAAIPNYGTYSAASPTPAPQPNTLDAYLSKSTSNTTNSYNNTAGYTTIASSYDYSQISAAEMAANDAAQETALEKFKNFAAFDDEDPNNRSTTRRRSRSRSRQVAQSNAYAYPQCDYNKHAY